MLRGGARLASHILYGVSRRLPSSKGTLAAPQVNEDLEREIQKARELALEVGWSLRRSEERLDASLQRIDSTLEELTIQRARIQELERDLGIER
jgi:hypothetical protein